MWLEQKSVLWVSIVSLRHLCPVPSSLRAVSLVSEGSAEIRMCFRHVACRSLSFGYYLDTFVTLFIDHILSKPSFACETPPKIA